MKDKKLAGWAASSSNPEEVSNRVKGIILALSSIIIFLGTNLFGINLSPQDVVDLAGQLGVVAGFIWGLWGAGIALVRFIAEKRA